MMAVPRGFKPYALRQHGSGTHFGRSAAVRAQQSAKAKVPQWGRQGNEQLMSLYAPLHALIGPSTPATTKANQLTAPVQLSGAFVAAQQQKFTP